MQQEPLISVQDFINIKYYVKFGSELEVSMAANKIHWYVARIMYLHHHVPEVGMELDLLLFELIGPCPMRPLYLLEKPTHHQTRFITKTHKEIIDYGDDFLNAF